MRNKALFKIFTEVDNFEVKIHKNISSSIPGCGASKHFSILSVYGALAPCFGK